MTTLIPLNNTLAVHNNTLPEQIGWDKERLLKYVGQWSGMEQTLAHLVKFSSLLLRNEHTHTR